MSLLFKSLKFNSPALGGIAGLQPNTSFSNPVFNAIASNLNSAESRQKRDAALFERKAEAYTSIEPEILFVCDYYVDNEFNGCLVVWERFFGDSTHYEVFKKNLFKDNPVFERVLFLDEASLAKERSYYIEYIQKVVGLGKVNPNYIYVFHDPAVKQDRIYEYKIKASRVPQKAAEVDYGFTLFSNKLATKVDLDTASPSTLRDTAERLLGSKDKAWIISLLNNFATFFGKKSATNSLYAIKSKKQFDESGNEIFEIKIPKNQDSIYKIFSESVSLFGSKESFRQALVELGGLSTEFIDAAVFAVDDLSQTFNFDAFVLELKSKSFVFAGNSLIPAVTARISANTGTVALDSVSSFTRVFNFISDMYWVVVYFEYYLQLSGPLTGSTTGSTSPLESVTSTTNAQTNGIITSPQSSVTGGTSVTLGPQASTGFDFLKRK